MAQLLLPFTTHGTPGTPENIGTKLRAAGWTGFMGLAELIITNDASQAGNISLSTNSAAAAEADGVVAASFAFNSGGAIADTISADEFYILSATASKKFSIYARSKV